MADYFSIMPVEIFMDDRLSKTDLRVLGAIMSWRNKTTNLCHPSREQISKRCRLPLCKISTATSHLVELGWLEKKGNGGRSSHCVYKFSIPNSIKYIEKEKLFIVYKTVNTITGQFYIGLHETLNINDGYYGSNQIVQSWDKNILNMDVLFYASDREEAALVEVDLIKNSIDDPLCVNKAVLLNEIYKNKTVTDSVTINEETVTDSVTKTVTDLVTKTVTDSVRGKKLKDNLNITKINTKEKINKKESNTLSREDVPEVSDQTFDDFMQLRKAKRLPLSMTAMEGIKKEASRAGITLETALKECCMRGWAGFKAEWYQQAPQNYSKQQLAQIAARSIFGNDNEEILINGEVIEHESTTKQLG